MPQGIEAQVAELDAFKDKLIEFCTTAGARLILALLIFIIGKIIISKLLKWFDKGKAASRIDPTARGFIRTFLKAALYIILVLSIIAELGVPMASIVAVIASCGVAVGLALQGALSNLAGGIMLLVFRPFSVGDYISSGSEEGTVKTISIMYTVLTTVDNREVFIPNGTLMNANITNATASDTRRIDLKFNIEGSQPVKKVQAAIMNVIINTDKAFADPAPAVEPLEPVPGGLAYTVRVWTNTADYWDVYFELMREIPAALAAEGIGGPASPVKLSN